MKTCSTYLSHIAGSAVLLVVYLSLICFVPSSSGEENANKNDQPSLIQPEDQVPDVEARLLLARAQKKQGKLEQALQQYQHLLQLRPEDKTLRLEYASTLLEAQKLSSARAELQRVLDHHPENIQALSLMARVQVRLNMPQAAKQTVHRISRLSDETSTETLTSLAHLYADIGETRQAARVLDELPITQKISAEKLADIADIYHRIGHARRCKKLYEQALARDDVWSIRRRFANRMLMWGAFYRATRIYRSHLKQTADKSEIQNELVSVLASSERYAQAIQLCHKILHDNPDNLETRSQLCRIFIKQKRFQNALNCAKRILQHDGNHNEGWFLKGLALSNMGNYERAIKALERVAPDSEWSVSSLILLGKAHQNVGHEERGRKQFQKALEIEPTNIQARFYLAPKQKRATDDFMKKLFNRENLTPRELTEWAQLYNKTGQRRTAIRCYTQALALDPAYFPAELGLAQTYAYNHQYERSLTSLRQLHADFPQSRKILLTRARANSWATHYKQAMKLYSRLHREMPGDPVPLLEKARTAMWGKMYDSAMQAYSIPLTPGLTQILRQDMRQKMPRTPSRGYQALQQLTATTKDVQKPFRIYSRLENKLNSEELPLSPSQGKTLKQILLDRYARYRVQKTFWQERHAKRLNWHRERLSALEAYKNLLETDPGNNEARFDLAQIQCALGLISRERSTYRRILHLDPLHNLAGKALDRIRVRTSPSIDMRYRFWHEWGRGDLTDIRRQRTALGLSVPIADNHTVRLSTIYLTDNPGGHHGFHGVGQRVHWTGVLSPALRSSVAFQSTNYRDKDGEDTLTGHARFSYNIEDYVTIGMGYRRQNEFFNVFGLRDGTQSNRWWLSLTSDLNHNLSAGYRGEYIDYNDDNAGQHQSAWMDYMLFDHPHQLNLEGRVDYRDTDENNRFITQGTQLNNIIHPYWTPRDYMEGTLTVRWRHDLSEFQFCGSQQHYYQIEISAGDSTDNNPFKELKATWNYEFANSWTINLSGLIHRSRDWDADGIWASLSYRF